MSLQSNINNIAFTSRYDVDKVIYKTSGSTSVPQAVTSADTVVVTIPHGLGYTPLCIGQYSEDNFSIAYEFGNPPYFYDTASAAWVPRIDGIIESDSTNIYVIFFNRDTTRTLYYRVVALIPSGITSSPKMDVSARDDLLFNANDNFLKILIDQKETRVFDGVNPQTIIVSHLLGYAPMALVFVEDHDDGRVRRAGAESQIGVTVVSTTASVDTSFLYINATIDLPRTATFHYRIYLDN